MNNEIKVRLINICLASLILIFLTSSPVIGQDSDRSIAFEAAKEGLQQWLKVIPKPDLDKYGFKSEAQFSQASLDSPFVVYTLSKDQILAHSDQDISSLIEKTDLWYFPILAEGEVTSLLIVDDHEGEIKVVGIGAAPLAKELETIRARWKGSDESTLRLVRIRSIKSDFILASTSATEEKVIPLESSLKALRLVETGLFNDIERRSKADGFITPKVFLEAVKGILPQ